MNRIEVKKAIKDNDPRIKWLSEEIRNGAILIPKGTYDCEIAERGNEYGSGGMKIRFFGSYRNQSRGIFNGSRMESFYSPTRDEGLEFYFKKESFDEYFSKLKT